MTSDGGPEEKKTQKGAFKIDKNYFTGQMWFTTYRYYLTLKKWINTYLMDLYGKKALSTIQILIYLYGCISFIYKKYVFAFKVLPRVVRLTKIYRKSFTVYCQQYSALFILLTFNVHEHGTPPPPVHIKFCFNFLKKSMVHSHFLPMTPSGFAYFFLEN